MTEFILGAEDGTTDGGSWTELNPLRGEVLEVYMPRTNVANAGDFWAAFLVFGTRILGDGSMLVSVKCMGCEDVELFQTIQRQMNVRGGSLHLCLSSPCAFGEEDEEARQAIHVTHVRRWEFIDIIDADYISRSMRTQSRGWYAEIMGQEIGRPARGPPEKKKKATKVPAAGGTRAPGGGVKGSSTKTPGLSEAAKAKLRQRLQQVRERALGTGAITTEVIISDGDDEEIQPTSTEDEGYSSAPERGKRSKPDNPFPPIPPLALDDLKVKEESKTKRKKTELREKKKKKKEKRKALDDAPRDVAPLVATSGGTSKSWRRQLVEKAVLASEMKAKDKKKKGNKKTSHSKKIQEALSVILTGSKKKKDKSKDGKKKKKRVVTSDGVIESFSESSNDESSDPSSSSSEETDLDTPMKKRSRDTPGSVLAMLVNHVKEQLDQGATTELPSEGSTLTSGIRVMTYFMLHLKPSFPTNLRELRELHHLAACIDVLRSGTGFKLGDGEAYGVVPHGGHNCSKHIDGAGNPKTYQVDIESTKSTGVELLGRLSRTRTRKRKGRLVEWLRLQGRERRKRKRQKGQERRKDEVAAVRIRSGLESQQGEAGRQEKLDESAPLAKAVRTRVQEFIHTNPFETIAGLCTNYRRAGSAMAWMVYHAGLCAKTNSWFFKRVFESGVWHRAGSKKFALPISGKEDYVCWYRSWRQARWKTLARRNFATNGEDHAGYC